MSDTFIPARLCDFELPPKGTKKFYLLKTCMMVAIKYSGRAQSPTRALLTDFTNNRHLVDRTYSTSQPLLSTRAHVNADQLIQVRWKNSVEFSEFLKTIHRVHGYNLEIKGSFTNTTGDFLFVRVKLSVKEYKNVVDGDIESIELLGKEDMDVNDDIYRRFFKLADTDLLSHTPELRKKFPREIWQKYTLGLYKKQQQQQQHPPTTEDRIGAGGSQVANIYTQGSSSPPDQHEEYLVKDEYNESNSKRGPQQEYINAAAKRMKPSNTIPFRKLNEISTLDDTIYTVSGYIVGITPDKTACRKIGRYPVLDPVKIYLSEDYGNTRGSVIKGEEDLLVLSFDTEFEILSFYSVKHIEEAFVYENYFKEKIEEIMNFKSIPFSFKIQRKKIQKGSGSNKNNKINKLFVSLGWNPLDININFLIEEFDRLLHPEAHSNGNYNGNYNSC